MCESVRAREVGGRGGGGRERRRVKGGGRGGRETIARVWFKVEFTNLEVIPSENRIGEILI